MSNETGRAVAFRVSVKDFKRIEEVEIDLEQGVIHEIRGDVNEGKTSVLDALAAAVSPLVSPSLVRRGADRATIELELDEATITRVIPAADETWTNQRRKWGTLAVTGGDGKAVEDGEGFLAALFGRFAFRPVEFVRLGAGDQAGMTERLRAQRNMLLQSLELTLTKDDIRTRFKGATPEVIAALKKMQLGTGVDFTAHAFHVVDALREQCSAGLTAANAEVERARSVLLACPAPAELARPEAVAELEQASRAAQEAYYAAKGRQSSVSSRADQANRLRSEIASAESGLKPRVDVDGARTKWAAETHHKRGELSRLEEELSRLQKRVETARSELSKAEGNVARCDEMLRALDAQDARRRDLQRLEEEMSVSGGAVVDLAALESEWRDLSRAVEVRQRQDLHDAAAGTVEAAVLQAGVYEGLVKEFRDVLPSELLASAKLGIDGLTVEGDRLLLDGLPLHQLGTSQTMLLAVKLWAAMYPRAPFCPVDGAESLGRSDLAALARAADEGGFKLVMTFVDFTASPGKPGVTVMKAGKKV